MKDDQEWCMDVFDHFVLAGQSATVGEAVVRRYRPVSADNDHIVLHIFSSDKDDCKVLYNPLNFCRTSNIPDKNKFGRNFSITSIRLKKLKYYNTIITTVRPRY